MIGKRGVTFYKSAVEMRNVSFEGSKAEDALNIVHSQFNIENSRFSNVSSDAFDSDFSDGAITSAHFRQVGGDGLDTSGSNVVVKNVTFTDITDKAVSAGENSRVSIERAQINRTGIGLASKDGSQLLVRLVNVEDFGLYAGMVYRKKSFYGNAEMRIVESNLSTVNLINQRGNTLILNTQAIPDQDLDVDRLYAQGPMKKIK